MIREWDEKAQRTFRQAVIVRPEEMFGNVRVRCPVDGTEHEVPVGSNSFICPVDGTYLSIEK